MPIMGDGCHGNGATHCCTWQGAVCPFLRENDPAAPGRRWSCERRNTLGSWDAVHADPSYIATLGPSVGVGLWRASGDEWDALWQLGIRCGSWPDAVNNLRPGDINRLAEPYRSAANAVKTKYLNAWAAWKNTGVRNDALCCFGGKPAGG